MAGREWILSTCGATDAGCAAPVECRILDDVERGEGVMITRHGKTIARISPEAAIDRERVQRATESFRAIRKRTKPVSLAEILSARDEGRM